uniref:glycosyltransferase n=1 Tax=Lutibacter sp. TaxID=1925666 RepID=UPI003561D5F7
YNIRLFFKLLFVKKDILLANDLDTLLPNYLVSKLFNKKIVYDSHELFTEVPELINRPFQQNFWLKIEQFIVPKLIYAYTVCDSIAIHYNTIYNSKFRVIRNIPIKIEEHKKGMFPFNSKNKKIILYQGALNKGRGLELMIESMTFLDTAIFLIIGSGDIEKKLHALVKELNLKEKVIFLDRISPNELQKITPLADLGISMEEDLGLNYRYALPNKLFDYIQAKIPVLVSNLNEMSNLVLTYNVGDIVLNRNPKDVAQQITKILQKDKDFYRKQLEFAGNELIWENESEKLIKLFKDVNSPI